MKPVLSAVAALALVSASSIAHADTRPAATQFQTADDGDDNEIGGELELLPLLIFGFGGFIGVLVAAASDQGNSPR